MIHIENSINALLLSVKATLEDVVQEGFKTGREDTLKNLMMALGALKIKSADEYKPGLEVAIDFINELIEGQ